MKTVKTVCPLDCFDVCSMITTIENGRVVKVDGNKENPVTKGYICPKGRAHVERLYHPQRLKAPQLKTPEGWVAISYDEAYAWIVNKIKGVLESHGSHGILNFNDCGYSGMSRSVEDMFFNHLGGSTTSHGSLCWGAGSKATVYDFGDRKGQAPRDLLNTKTLILWGRNPAANNIHFIEHLKAAKKNGTRVILIDPVATKTAQYSDHHIRIQCSKDGHLAMAMAKVILEKGLADHGFIEAHVHGFEAYKSYLDTLDIQDLSDACGVDIETIAFLAETYAMETPASIWIGYGMQRYQNGGNSVRAIDALGAITGMIGKPGGGVTYTHKGISKFIEGPIEASEALAINKRTFPKPKLAEYLLESENPAIQMLWITRSNPMTQVPNVNKLIEAFDKVPYKVVIDMFMTDTAKHADLVLPATSIFEEEDFIYSSMYNPLLQYSEKAIEPMEGMIGEYDVYRALAERLHMESYPKYDQDAFFEHQLASLCRYLGVSYETCKKQDMTLEGLDVPYEDLVFETPTGRIELVSSVAELDGVSPHARLADYEVKTEAFPYRLLTIRSPKSTNSQHFLDRDERPILYIHPEDAENRRVSEDDLVRIKSKQGEILAHVSLEPAMLKGVLKVNQGWWHKSGCVNLVTSDALTDMGDQAAFYDTFVNIEKL